MTNRETSTSLGFWFIFVDEIGFSQCLPRLQFEGAWRVCCVFHAARARGWRWKWLLALCVINMGQCGGHVSGAIMGKGTASAAAANMRGHLEICVTPMVVVMERV
jgi:hypothetical protein